MNRINKIIRWPFLTIITLYQKTISPDHGLTKDFFPNGYCKYEPTCSEYTKQSIEKHGVILGFVMGCWRILRCNPWSKGGKDPVPNSFVQAFGINKKKSIGLLWSSFATFVLSQDVIIFLLITTGAKIAYFNHLIDINYPLSMMWSGYFLSFLTSAIIFVPLMFLSKARKLIAIIIASLILLILSLDLVYFRIFHSLPTFGLIGAIGQTGDVLVSVYNLFKWTDWFLGLDILLSAFYQYYLRKQLRIKDHYSQKNRFWEKITLTILLLSVTTTVVCFAYIPKANRRLVDSVTTAYETRINAQYFGVIASHLIDGYLYIVEDVNLVPLEDKLDLVRWVEANLMLEKSESSFTGLARGKRVIMIQVESLSNLVLDKSINDTEITPNLNKLKTSSYYFSDMRFVIGAGHTSDTDLVVNTSLYPLNDSSAFVRYGRDDYIGLADVLSSRGYTTSAYHAYNRNFWNRSEALDSLGYEKFFAAESYSEGDSMNISGLNDRDFMGETAKYLLELPEKSLAYIITLSSHHPFHIDDKYKNLDLDEIHISQNDKGYLQNISFTDDAIGKFFDTLRQANLFDDSLIVVFGDHSPTIDSFDYENITYDMSGPDSLRVPLLVKLPFQDTSYIDERTVTTLDIMPTLLDLLGYSTEAPMFGESLLVSTGLALPRCDNGEVVHVGDAVGCAAAIEQEKEMSAKIIKYNVF